MGWLEGRRHVHSCKLELWRAWTRSIKKLKKVENIIPRWLGGTRGFKPRPLGDIIFGLTWPACFQLHYIPVHVLVVGLLVNVHSCKKTGKGWKNYQGPGNEPASRATGTPRSRTLTAWEDGWPIFAHSYPVCYWLHYIPGRCLCND